MNPPGDKRSDAAASGSPPPRDRVAATETYVDLMERLAPGTRVAGRYEIVSIAGVGGMGVVYRARDRELDVDVALKALRQDLGADPRVVERFRRELVSARQVTHKNVVRLHDIGEHEGMRFLTMDYVQGRSLREILEREGPLSAERAGAILRQVAEALEAAHQKGIVHRDLKPGNILIDAAGTAFITDFGVARSLERTGMTRAGGIVGTPDYLAPEQVSGAPVDGRTDLYALGIVFFEMLSGQLPFSGESQAEILAQRLAGRPRDLKEVGIAAPAWAREVIRRCLERSPARRYPDARSLIEDLDQAARPARPRAARWKKATLVAVVLAVVAAALWSIARHRAGPTGVPQRGGEQPAPAAARHAVAVLPFADQTGQAALAWTGPGIAEMLSSNLAESSNLRVLDSQRVSRGVRDLRIAAGPVEERTARQLAEIWSVDTLVTGTVRRAGPRVRVDVSVLQVGPSGTVAGHPLFAEGDGEADIFRVVAALGSELRQRLGLSAQGIPVAPVAETGSLDAAKAYEEGKTRLARSDDRNAAPAFERAVAADSRFAGAFEKLAETYESLGYHEKAVAAAERAVAAAGTGESRSTYRARARLALVRGDPAEAEKSYQELVRKYPHDTEQKLDLAAAQAAQGHNAQAVETLKAIVAADPNDPRAWLLLGRNTIFMGDNSRAIKDYLVRALALQTQLGNEKGKADVLAAVANAYQRMNEYSKALENYAEAWKIQEALGDERGLASTLRGRSLILQAMGKVGEAEADLAAARKISEKIDDRVGVSDAWNASGVLAEARGAYRRALEAYQNGLKLRRTLGNERLLAQSYDNVGYIYYLQGEYDNALVYWQQALDLRKRIGERGGVILSLQNMGFLQTAQGHWDEAVRTFLDALEKSREMDDKGATIISLGNLGILYGLRGRFSAALSSFDEAIGMARGMQFQAALTEFTLKKASVLLDLGRGQDAKALMAEAQKWVGQTENSEQAADLEILRAESSAAEGDRRAAREALRRARPLAEKSGSRSSILEARIASAAETQGGAGIAALSTALSETESVGHSLLTIRASEALARGELSRGRAREAERSARRAIEVAERVGWSSGLYRLYGLQGRILEAAGDRAGSAEAFTKASREVAKLRENVPDPMRASFESLPAVRDVLARTGQPRA